MCYKMNISIKSEIFSKLKRVGPLVPLPWKEERALRGYFGPL